MEFLDSIPLIGPVLYWVLPFLVVLSIVVAIHELGHLMVGRWCGIHAEVFSVGFGKVLWSRTDKHGTQWQIAALPLGGYVKFLGDMDPASAGQVDDSELTEAERSRAFHNAALWKRAATVVAGPLANFILSFAIFLGLAFYAGQATDEPVIAGFSDAKVAESGLQVGDRVLRVGETETPGFGDIVSALFRTNGEPTEVLLERDGSKLTVEVTYGAPPLVTGISASGEAIAAGVRPGDLITSVDGTPIKSARQLQLFVADAEPGKELIFGIMRDGEARELAFTPELVTRTHPRTGTEQPVPTMGIHLPALGGILPQTEPVGLGLAAEHAVKRVWTIIADSVTYIGRMIFDDATTDHLSGPIGIAKFSAQAAERGPIDLIGMIALISTAIGFLNLFPIPVLDGGHLVFYFVEWIRGKPINEAIVRYGSAAGLSLLLLLMVFVTFNNDLGLGAWLSQD